MTAHSHIAVAIGLQPIDIGRFIHIVSTGGHPELAIFVCFQMVQVRSHLYLVCLLHRREVNDAYRTLIALPRHTLIAAAVGHIETVTQNGHLLRLIAHADGVCLL